MELIGKPAFTKRFPQAWPVFTSPEVLSLSHGQESTGIEGTSRSQAGPPLRPQPSPWYPEDSEGLSGVGRAEGEERWAF